MSSELPAWLEAYGPRLPLSSLVETVNTMFHSFAAASYDGDHPEIRHQLPPLWSEMMDLLPAGRCWNVLDLGCGTGFEAELVLSRLGGQVRAFTAYDPSAAMICRCRARLQPRYPQVVYCSQLEEGYSRGPFDLLLTNSLLHHLPEMGRTITALLPHLTADALWLAGHEPSARFFRNRACVRLLTDYRRFRKYARWLNGKGYVSRLQRWVKKEPLGRTAQMAFDQGLFLKRPTPDAIDRLVDFGVCRSADDAGEGMDPELLSSQLQLDWKLQWSKSYAFLGPFPLADVPESWARKARELEQTFPRDGANFCTVWRRDPAHATGP